MYFPPNSSSSEPFPSLVRDQGFLTNGASKGPDGWASHALMCTHVTWQEKADSELGAPVSLDILCVYQAPGDTHGTTGAGASFGK